MRGERLARCAWGASAAAGAGQPAFRCLPACRCCPPRHPCAPLPHPSPPTARRPLAWPAGPQVCLSVLGNLAASLTPAEKKDLHAIEAKLGKFCEKPSNERDTKFCYFVDPIKREISQPLKNGAPPATVCDRLKKKAPEVCALRYGAAPAAVTVTRATDLGKLRVKDLKAFIAEKSIACSPCVASSCAPLPRRLPSRSRARALPPPPLPPGLAGARTRGTWRRPSRATLRRTPSSKLV